MPSSPPERAPGFWTTVALPVLGLAAFAALILFLGSLRHPGSYFAVSRGTPPEDKWVIPGCNSPSCAPAQHLNWRWTLDVGARMTTDFTPKDSPTPGRTLGYAFSLGTDDCAGASLIWTVSTAGHTLGAGALDTTTPRVELALPLPGDATTITVAATRRDNEPCTAELVWHDGFRTS